MVAERRMERIARITVQDELEAVNEQLNIQMAEKHREVIGKMKLAISTVVANSESTLYSLGEKVDALGKALYRAEESIARVNDTVLNEMISCNNRME